MTAEILIPELAEDVHLWLASAEDYQAQLAEASHSDLLTGAEIQRYEELARPEHRLEYLAGRVFLREILSAYTGIPPNALAFDKNPSGKPALVAEQLDTPLNFNFSHGADGMACAVTAKNNIGVDVESVSEDRGMVEVADHYFSSIELAGLEALGAADQQQQFFRIWTLKEAYIKARGEGHSQSLDSFSFYCPQPGIIKLVVAGQEVPGWGFWSLQSGAGEMVAVAVQSSSAELRVFSRSSKGIQKELPLASLGEVA